MTKRSVLYEVSKFRVRSISGTAIIEVHYSCKAVSDLGCV